MIACCIFDLDGVIVDTARFHYEAWAALACRLGFEFTPGAAEATKGVSRMESLAIMLRAGGLEGRFSDVEKQRLADEKNAAYLEYVSCMTPADVLPGVRNFLLDVRRRGVKTALGSSSKNARLILDRCDLAALFDAVADGTQVVHAKPDPELFLLAARLTDTAPAACVVFEDAATGIEAAARAGMRSVGVGDNPLLAAATMRINSFEDFDFEKLLTQL